MSDDETLHSDPDFAAWCDARDEEAREHQDAHDCDDTSAQEVA